MFFFFFWPPQGTYKEVQGKRYNLLGHHRGLIKKFKGKDTTYSSLATSLSLKFEKYLFIVVNDFTIMSNGGQGERF